jgi:hypothetical protein
MAGFVFHAIPNPDGRVQILGGQSAFFPVPQSEPLPSLRRLPSGPIVCPRTGSHWALSCLGRGPRPFQAGIPGCGSLR